MKKLLIACEYTNPNQNSTGYFWSKIISRLENSEGFVTVISPGKYVKYDSFNNNTGLLNRIFKQIRISSILIAGIAKKSNKDCILLCGTNPTILLALTPILKRIFKFRWILLVHDVFPENMVAAKIIKYENIVFKQLSNYFSWVYASADLLICIGRDMQELMEKKTNNGAKTVFIPNWTDENEIFPLPRHSIHIFEKYKWQKKIVFQFFGNIGRVQGIQNLLSAISLTKADNAAFVFIGGGAFVPYLENFIEAHPEKDIKYIGPMPLDKKNDGLAMCDIALVALDAGMLGLGVPSKAYFSLAAGKPILAVVEERSEIARMIAENSIGWRCNPNEPEQLAILIDEICDAPLEIAKTQSRKVFLDNYTEEIVLSNFANCVNSFVDNDKN